MGLRTRLLVSNRARLTLGDCVLTVDDVARSSMIVTIPCLTLGKITSIRNCLRNEVSSGVRTAQQALYSLEAAVVIPPRISNARPSNVDYSSHRLLGLSTCLRISTLSTWRMKEVLRTVRYRQLPPLQWMLAVVPAMENVVYPHLSSV